MAGADLLAGRYGNEWAPKKKATKKSKKVLDRLRRSRQAYLELLRAAALSYDSGSMQSCRPQKFFASDRLRPDLVEAAGRVRVEMGFGLIGWILVLGESFSITDHRYYDYTVPPGDVALEMKDLLPSTQHEFATSNWYRQ